jgi:hypothetical protein
MTSVAAGLRPAVKGGILPPGLYLRISNRFRFQPCFSRQRDFSADQGGRFLWADATFQNRLVASLAPDDSMCAEPVQQAGQNASSQQPRDDRPPKDDILLSPQVSASHPRQQIKSLPRLISAKPCHNSYSSKFCREISATVKDIDFFIFFVTLYSLSRAI